MMAERSLSRFVMLDETLIESDDRNARSRKWLLLPLSLLVHALVIAALVVVPLLLAENQLPDVKVTNILILAPPRPTPPPPPPPPPPKRRGSGGANKAGAKNTEKPPVYTGKLVAPFEVPVTIEEDDGSDFGVEGGVEGGVPGGVLGGVEGGVIGGVLGGVLGGTLPDEQPVFVSGKNIPKLIRQVKPEYPPEAYSARIQAVVIVEAATDIYGRVNRARIISGHPVFNEAALAAVRQWLYEPYIVGGVPRPIYFTVSMTFGFISN
jgi:periplasmic protein TonB